MYSVAYLPIALRDLQEIVRYIADSLHNPTAAMQTAEGIVAAIERLGTMPYRRAVYAPILPLSHEFRTIRYKSHVAFYWVEEDCKTVTVARILYAKADISKRLARAERQLP
ncbi:type II toxin-antitoxin system RelE/ParE family toxin [Collinsella intestinalis]|uniref:type II toxin-antitoxin system RelE/ParE family toxin n=1 Tax=Collinsella intestinalis TaxID=147207 RepID=UPI001959C379|nr:type II toxin-antitoxin system RelE/ParE family toxin [Collinsella intestinalis]MBM6943351.1 type II toxin-antitoxin system RelE/ParE family toxin [Collinsella intestinalis]